MPGCGNSGLSSPLDAEALCSTGITAAAGSRLQHRCSILVLACTVSTSHVRQPEHCELLAHQGAKSPQTRALGAVNPNIVFLDAPSSWPNLRLAKSVSKGGTVNSDPAVIAGVALRRHTNLRLQLQIISLHKSSNTKCHFGRRAAS